MDIILMEPEEPGNIGAVARAMKNFGFSNLILVNPKCDYLGEASRNRAKHAQDVLAKVKVVSKLPKYHTLIGTTGRLGTDYNVPRSPIIPKNLQIPKKGKIGILFGREGVGLMNDEIQICDFIVSIPSNPEYPVLNLSHAVTIVLYELYQLQQQKSTDHFIPASIKEKDQTLNIINETIDSIEFST